MGRCLVFPVCQGKKVVQVGEDKTPVLGAARRNLRHFIPAGANVNTL